MTEFHLNILREAPSDIDKSIVCVGMPGIGSVGKLTITNLIKSLHAEKILEIFCSDFPPHVLVKGGGLLYVPRTSIYHCRLEDDGTKRDFFFITGDYQPTSQTGVYEFAEYITKKCTEFKAEMIIATAAFVREHLTEVPRVFISSTSQKTLESFMEAKKAELFKSGTITGANGIIPALGPLYGIVGVSCLGETVAALDTDPRAAKAIVEVLNDTLNISIETLFLDELIERLEPVLEKAKTKIARDQDRDRARSQQYIS